MFLNSFNFLFITCLYLVCIVDSLSTVCLQSLNGQGIAGHVVLSQVGCFNTWKNTFFHPSLLLCRIPSILLRVFCIVFLLEAVFLKTANFLLADEIKSVIKIISCPPLLKLSELWVNLLFFLFQKETFWCQVRLGKEKETFILVLLVKC